MAFNKAVELNTKQLGSGEVIKSKPYNTEAFETFEDGLKFGRFVKFDSGSVDMLDGSSAPKIAGVTRRKITAELEVDMYRNTGKIIDSVAEVHNFGYVTVELKDGDTPSKFDLVYALNAVGDDAGKATTDNTAVATGAVFWEQKDINVWLIVIPNYMI